MNHIKSGYLCAFCLGISGIILIGWSFNPSETEPWAGVAFLAVACFFWGLSWLNGDLS